MRPEPGMLPSRACGADAAGAFPGRHVGLGASPTDRAAVYSSKMHLGTVHSTPPRCSSFGWPHIRHLFRPPSSRLRSLRAMVTSGLRNVVLVSGAWASAVRGPHRKCQAANRFASTCSLAETSGLGRRPGRFRRSSAARLGPVGNGGWGVLPTGLGFVDGEASAIPVVAVELLNRSGC
jgi:hypothetical protein